VGGAGWLTLARRLVRSCVTRSQSVVKQYSQARIGDLPPHIFAIAEAAFYNMRTQNENQSVIISGAVPPPAAASRRPPGSPAS